MLKSSDWKSIVTFKQYKKIAKNKYESYILPNDYELIDENIIGVIEKEDYFYRFCPVKLSNNAKNVIRENKK